MPIKINHCVGCVGRKPNSYFLYLISYYENKVCNIHNIHTPSEEGADMIAGSGDQPGSASGILRTVIRNGEVKDEIQ